MTPYISKTSLVELLFSLGIDTQYPLIADEEYAIPSKSWILGEFSRAFLETKVALVGRYIPDEWDCDDFARLCAAYAGILHHRTRNKLKKNQGFALGEFWYIQSKGGGHAINIVVDRDLNDQPLVYFYEPQTTTIMFLDKEEIRSCFMVRF